MTAIWEEVPHVIFLDQHKAYYALDRDICLQILEVYGVGTQALHLLQRYWVFLTIVSRSGGYYGAPFKGYRGQHRGNHSHPHYMMWLRTRQYVIGSLLWWQRIRRYRRDGEGRSRGRNYSCIQMMALEWLQGEFDALTGMFDRLGLQANVGKTVGIVFQP